MTAYYNEIDPKAAAWLRELIKQGHIADGVVDDRSIVDVRPDELREFTQCHFFAGIGVWSYALRSAGWSDDRPVWTGSCPCQPFSAAGARGGFDDQRHLWPHWHHLISQCRPPVVFGEQVASKDGLGWLDLVHADMEATGYAFGAADLCAAGVGAPHIRQRLWFVGMADADNTERRADTARGNVGDGHHAGRQEGAGHAEGRGGDHGLADAADAGLQVGRGRSGGEPGSVEQSERLRADGGLADADGRDASAEGVQRGGEQRQQPEDGGVGGLGDPGGAAGQWNAREVSGAEAGEHGTRVAVDGRLPVRPEHAGAGVGGLADAAGNGSGASQRGEFQSHLQQAKAGWNSPKTSGHAVFPDAAGPTNGFWRDADWLFCRDGKWRPVEPGTFPLADGSPARVGRLRGYGNAIAAPVAQEFIESVMEILE